MSATTRVLFATSNGTGLGHLTRSMAIAHRLDPEIEPLFLTLSAAAPVVDRLGLPVEYVASYDRPGAGNDLTWTLRTRERFRVAVREADPRVVVFDGTHPYERLLPALRASGADLVWCRRGMWRDGADTAPLHRTHLFDHVLEPGELGTGGDRGPTAPRRAEAHVVDPICLVDRSQLLPRALAEAELGLEPGRRNVLVQLGQGPGVGEATARCLKALAARDDVQVATLSSALAGLEDVPEGVVHLHATYPIARLFAAFDAAVSAAGYNAFHELTGLWVPTLFVPMPRATDDQAARACDAASAGVALTSTGADDPALEQRLEELLDPDIHRRLRTGLEGLGESRGAEQAAAWLGSIAAHHGRARGSARGAPEREPAAGPGARVRARRAWIFASTVPRTLRRVVGQSLARARARVHVLALGLDPERGAARLESALASIGEPPEQVLVITDHLDFAPLLAAGVGIEHVPARGSRQAELAGVAYEDFRAGRLALIRARRPRPRRVIDLADTSRSRPVGPVA